jgi:hypothetical protein
MGEGQLAQKLSLKDWMTFQNYQRVHYNYLGQDDTAHTTARLMLID